MGERSVWKERRENTLIDIFSPANEEYGICGTFREGKELAWDKIEWMRVVAANQSEDCILYDDS